MIVSEITENPEGACFDNSSEESLLKHILWSGWILTVNVPIPDKVKQLS